MLVEEQIFETSNDANTLFIYVIVYKAEFFLI